MISYMPPAGPSAIGRTSNGEITPWARIESASSSSSFFPKSFRGLNFDGVTSEIFSSCSSVNVVPPFRRKVTAIRPDPLRPDLRNRPLRPRHQKCHLRQFRSRNNRSTRRSRSRFPLGKNLAHRIHTAALPVPRPARMAQRFAAIVGDHVPGFAVGFLERRFAFAVPVRGQILDRPEPARAQQQDQQQKTQQECSEIHLRLPFAVFLAGRIGSASNKTPWATRPCVC